MNSSRVTGSVVLGLRLRRWATALVVGIAGIAPSSSAADAAAGTILGSVSSAGTQNALQGAVVRLPALNRTELTDNAGGFTLGHVPSGTIELIISYTGFNDERRTVTVRAGETTRLEAVLKPTPAITMDAFTLRRHV